jgi:hypothetical protein
VAHASNVPTTFAQRTHMLTQERQKQKPHTSRGGQDGPPAKAVVILSEAKNLIQFGVAQIVASSASLSPRFRRGYMVEMLRRERRSSA